ncbi:MAG: pyruvate kinase [Bacteroidales bacterium]|jgi:pyruvate kinase|nr:pyruvate kinase [Bacteroidales bacterium]MDD4383799.1 pyruvate kinase [Bacteroidales bacterium]MDY0197983.1 pyruvate kinase [Tenuifilaceae bacterium]
MLKKTKIVATISDKKCDVEFIRELFEAGMNVIRLNTAHQSIEQAKKVIENVRSVSSRIAILVDTKGPEIRTSAFGEELTVCTGDMVKVFGNPNGQTGNGLLYVSYPSITKEISKGDYLLIDDGEIELRVVSVEKEHLDCQATNCGIIKFRKSVNIPNAKINLPSLTAKDIDFIEFAIKNDVDFIAHSFVRTKQDVLDIKNIIDKHNSKIKIIAKIENQQGVDNIEEILDHTYGIMVARGDLGIEIAAEKIPNIQRYLINKCIESKKPVIIATQMLHTMIEHPRPTRAEINDIASAIYQRADAIMLSGETAYGQYPIDSVKTMTRVAYEVEKELDTDPNITLTRIHNKITATLARSAVRACNTLPIKAIVIDTMTGRTGRYLSAFRGKVPVYAMCYNETIMRQLALSYGIMASYMELTDSRDSFLSNAIRRLTDGLSAADTIKPDDMVLVIGGSFGPTNGSSFLEISEVKNLLKKHY